MKTQISRPQPLVDALDSRRNAPYPTEPFSEALRMPGSMGAKRLSVGPGSAIRSLEADAAHLLSHAGL